MISEGYIHPGRYADEHGSEITVTRQTSDGRYEVDYGSGVRSTLLGQTIRQVYGVAAVAVAALALLPALASAAPAKHAQLTAAAAQVKVAEQQLYQTGSLPAGTALRVACTGTRKRIVCIATANATFGSYDYTETFKVHGGTLTSAAGLVPTPK
jgi:hypothetical protein